MLVVGLDQLLVLLLDLLGVLAGRAEQHLLEVAEQVLPGLRGDLPVGDGGLQVADERGSRRGGRRQRGGVLSFTGCAGLLAVCAGRLCAAWRLGEWPGA